MWDTELNDALTTRAPSTARSTDDGDETDMDTDNDEEEELRGFPEHLDGRAFVDLGCRWLAGRGTRKMNPHRFSDKLREHFGLDVVAFRKALRYVQDREKCWGYYIVADPDYILDEIKAEWPHLDEAKI